MKYENIVVPISNYATNALGETLFEYGKIGFKLVNVVMAQNQYNFEVMYLFFTKELVGEQYMPYELLDWKPKLPPIKCTWQEIEKELKELVGEQ